MAKSNAIIGGKRFDGNVLVRDFATKSTPSNPTTSNKKSNETIANEVIQGLWGNGDDRKQRLADAGYNYSDIQSIVNQKLGVSTASSNYYPKYTGNSGSIVDALKSLGINSSKDFRKSLASKNGISNYTGSSSQNITLLNLLKQGKLKK